MAVEHLGLAERREAARRRGGRRRARATCAMARAGASGARRLRSPPRTSGAVAGPAQRVRPQPLQLVLGERDARAGVEVRHARAVGAAARAARRAARAARAGAAWRARRSACARGSRCSRRRLTCSARGRVRRPLGAARAASCARSSRVRCSGAGGARELARPPRRHLLQQRDIPLPRGEHRRELLSSAALRRRQRAPVKEVPAEDQHVTADPVRVKNTRVGES